MNETRLKVAIVGSGPAGFYTADFLLKEKQLAAQVDMFERLPTPFGLVRFGVAPDHQKIKKVTAAFERTAQNPNFRFFGNVELGRDLTIEQLLEHYDQVVVATGAATDRRLNVPGEDLAGIHAATCFVGWYNGHPDFVEQSFDLRVRRAVVVGMGNVAMDVARMLIQPPQRLKETDIADYAQAALEESQVREVVLLGRRGAAQAAFDQRELQDIAELEGVAVCVDRALPESGPEVDTDTATGRKNVEYIRSLPVAKEVQAERRVVLKLLASPVEISGSDGRVRAVRIERNQLVARADGSFSARGTGTFEELEAGLVLRSIGYHGLPVPGLPFDERSGTIPNRQGRVTAQSGGATIPRLYTVGWIKRGPTGLIGTNKNDARETADVMLEDARTISAGVIQPDVMELLKSRDVKVVSFADWTRIDTAEKERGKSRGCVRCKYYRIAEMLEFLEQ